jgi:ATP:corrinoid adenosyltransferase
MEDVLGIKNPRVGLVNVGVEEAKGNQLVKETGPLLKECENRSDDQTIIMTGRQIPEALIPYADAVYEISTIKES